MVKSGVIDIIFLINIKDKESFAKCSNFINKVTKHEQLSHEETAGILYNKGGQRADGIVGSHEWHRFLEEKYNDFSTENDPILKSKLFFSEIQTPQDISKVDNRFRIVYYLRIDEKDICEIVQYRELILLVAGYKNECIYAHIKVSKNFYFKLSQYISWISSEFSRKDAILFEDGDGIKGIQVNNVRQSTGFLPLIAINENNVRRLKDKCIRQLGESAFRKIITSKNRSKYKDIREEIAWEELGGIIMQFLNNKDMLKK